MERTWERTWERTCEVVLSPPQLEAPACLGPARSLAGAARVVAILCAGLITWSCSSNKGRPASPDGADGAGGIPGRLQPPLPWLKTSGTRIVREDETPLRLSGVVLSNNAWGNWVSGVSEARTAAGLDPLVRPLVQDDWCLTDADFAMLERLPINVVRYDFNYELFAPDNPQRPANLARLVGHVHRLGELGIYTILDLNMPLGLDTASDAYERSKPPSVREKSYFEDDAFYAATIEMWRTVAAELASEPALAAFELSNEPRAPSTADGGLVRYQERLQGLADAIRDVDARHIILVPEHNSRELDDEQQSVSWEQGMVTVTGSNIGYVLHFYTPFTFTSDAGSGYVRAELEADLARRTTWRDTVGHAPLVATEYSVSMGQAMDQRLAWLEDVHELFRANDISATWFNYKTEVSVFVPTKTIMGLYGQYIRRDQQVQVTSSDGGPASYTFVNQDVAAAAATNGFVPLFEQHFLGIGSRDLSPMGNQPIIEALGRFLQ